MQLELAGFLVSREGAHWHLTHASVNAFKTAPQLPCPICRAADLLRVFHFTSDGRHHVIISAFDSRVYNRRQRLHVDVATLLMIASIEYGCTLRDRVLDHGANLRRRRLCWQQDGINHVDYAVCSVDIGFD